MQKLYTNNSVIDARTLVSYLASYDIAAQVSQGPYHLPEVWILHDADAEKAVTQLSAWIKLQKQPDYQAHGSPVQHFRQSLAIASLLAIGALIIHYIYTIFRA